MTAARLSSVSRAASAYHPAVDEPERREDEREGDRETEVVHQARELLLERIAEQPADDRSQPERRRDQSDDRGQPNDQVDRELPNDGAPLDLAVRAPSAQAALQRKPRGEPQREARDDRRDLVDQLEEQLLVAGRLPEAGRAEVGAIQRDERIGDHAVPETLQHERRREGREEQPDDGEPVER